MELRLLAVFIFLKYIVAQDVDVPGDLLEPKTTTQRTIPSTFESIEPPIEIIATTASSGDNFPGSWIIDPNQDIPIFDRLTDDTLPLYVYPQCQNSNPVFTQNSFPIFNQFPQYVPIQPFNLNENIPSVTAPPIFDTHTVDPEYEEWLECPNDHFKSGSTCIPFNSFNCEFPSKWIDGRCVLSEKTCPVNFDFDGTSCVERQICPSNHIWQDGKCVLPQPTCPPEWRWNGEKCESEKIECQEGYVLKGKDCVYERISCPTGQEMVNGQCTKPTPICQPGQELQESGFCKEVKIKCPNRTELVNGKCENKTMTCPKGYEKIGDQCFKIIDVPATQTPIVTTQTPIFTTQTPIVTNQPPLITTWPSIATTTQFPRFTTTTRKPIIINPPEITTFPSIPDIDIPITSACPDGFTFYNGQCYRCPFGYNLCNGICLKHVAPCQPNFINPPLQPMPNIPIPNIPVPNINIHLSMPNYNPSPSHSGSKPVHIINNIEPVNNTIHNINNITHPVVLNNVNENNIYVYMDTQCADGKIRTTIIKNNQTIIGCEDSNKEQKIPDDRDDEVKTPKPEKCCEIVTPRRCKKRFTNQWMCVHRRHKHCGEVCIANRLYVRPPATVWVNQVLTIAPPPVQKYIKPCFGDDCPPVDCTGCIDGSYNCSPQCYTYPCYGDGCTYINQDQFCENVNDQDFCSR